MCRGSYTPNSRYHRSRSSSLKPRGFRGASPIGAGEGFPRTNSRANSSLRTASHRRRRAA